MQTRVIASCSAAGIRLARKQGLEAKALFAVLKSKPKKGRNMTDQELFLLSVLIGASVGMDIIVSVGFLAWFLGLIHGFWQLGRELAQTITEKTHKRRVERLAKMIEHEQARQPGPLGQTQSKTKG
jgi:hypothetical protein